MSLFIERDFLRMGAGMRIQSRMEFSVNGVVVLAFGLIWAACCQCVCNSAEESATTLYPRKLGEIKAMIQLLAPDKGAGSNAQNTYLQRLKQYRYICGVPYEDIQWDSQLAVLTKKASLVCAMLGQITHSPSKPAGMTDDEFELAKKGAKKSNLFMGITDTLKCVDGWMHDSFDQSVIPHVGHRRWCLNPAMLHTAFSSEGKFAAMYACDHSRASVPDWDFVAYPARGYMPLELFWFGIPYAWSVSLNAAKYEISVKDTVQVSIKSANDKLQAVGVALKLDYFNVAHNKIGSGPAIIFRPEKFRPISDARYLVEIVGLKSKGNQPATLRYLVHFIDIQNVPDSPDARAIYTAYFKRQLKAAQSLTAKVDQFEALAALAEDKFLNYGDPSVDATLRNNLTELLKDPALRREHEAAQRYKKVADFETNAGKKKDQLLQAANSYRDLAQAFKETRAGLRAAEDFERLKKATQ